MADAQGSLTYSYGKARSKRKRKLDRVDQLKAARAAKERKKCLQSDPRYIPDTTSIASSLSSGNDSLLLPPKSRSSEKLTAVFDSHQGEYHDKFEGFILVDIDLLQQVIAESSVCKVCKDGTLSLSCGGKYGLASRLVLGCSNDYCNYQTSFHSSKRCAPRVVTTDKPESSGLTPFEVNYRAVLGMRLLGRGFDGLRLLCGMMNLPNSMKQKTYSSLLANILDASSRVAEKSMDEAAREVRMQGQGEEIVQDVTCIFDGTWHKRGFSSLTGVVTCISTTNYKVIDVEDLQKYCKECLEIKKLQLPKEKETKLILDHECKATHTGSSAAMEVSGVRKIFMRSIKKRKLRITGYVGDGDTKSFETIKNEKPYGEDYEIVKKECVGHIQKRMGTNLRKLKSKSGNKILNDGKTLGGKGRLTFNEIDKLQLYYGLAIRRNLGNLDAMKKDISAILRHRLSTDELPNHSECPTGPSSWCGYNKDPSGYMHSRPLPKAVAVFIKPIFDRLKEDKLLVRCLDGYTQNSVESFNSVLWNICPKTTFVGSIALKVCLALAVVLYNDGHSKLCDILTELGICVGKNSLMELKRKDNIRIYKAEYKSSECQKKIRKAKRKNRHAEEDENLNQEGIMYEYGAF